MTEYLPRILAALAALVAIGWYCYRWGRDNGYAEGHADGEIGIQQRGQPQERGGHAVPGEPPSPDLSGGPRERA